jgi:hypothetical protein
VMRPLFRLDFSPGGSWRPTLADSSNSDLTYETEALV